MTTEVSQLYEQIAPELLDESGLYEVHYIDGVTKRLAEKVHMEVEVTNPFSFDPKPFLPDDGSMDLRKFKEVAADIVTDAQIRERVVSTETVQVVQEYQPERFHLLGDEVITVRVLKRIPANMDRKGTGRPQRASGFAYRLQLPAHPNKVIVVESRPIDHKIEFAIWAKTSLIADRRALWLERLFVTHAWMFAAQGVERMLWEGRGVDEVQKHGEQPLHIRRLNFFVRLREHEVYAYPAIRELQFTASINP